MRQDIQVFCRTSTRLCRPPDEVIIGYITSLNFVRFFLPYHNQESFLCSFFLVVSCN